MKYPKSGSATGAIPMSTNKTINLMGFNLATNRKFCLQELHYQKSDQNAGKVFILDLTAAASTNTVSSSTAIRFVHVSDYGVTSEQVLFPSEGITFEKGCVVTASGSTAMLNAGGLGYEF